MFTIVFPSFADFGYTKLLVETLEEYTKVPYEIIVHDNTSGNDVKEYLEFKNIKRTSVGDNIGPAGVNLAAKEAKYPYLVILNDDHCALPKWDINAIKHIEEFEEHNIYNFLLSCRVIQRSNQYQCYIANYGDSYSNFQKEKIEKDIDGIMESSKNEESKVLISQPQIVSTKHFLESGGLVEGAGWGAEDSVAINLYNIGCRNFKRINDSLFYHFISKSNGCGFSRISQQELFNKLKVKNFFEWQAKVGIGKNFTPQKGDDSE